MKNKRDWDRLVWPGIATLTGLWSGGLAYHWWGMEWGIIVFILAFGMVILAGSLCSVTGGR